ncbi:MAG TPA: hydrogenase maturation protease [Thermoanaerobaculia bacterium]|nr:hydrogenase maturation protease [Thermoanaerobaculia bacterium]
MRVLVGGIGNVFLGDDAFGVAVAARLRDLHGRDGVEVVDFGIRGIDLAYALAEVDAAILIDTVTRGGAPGTLYVLEPEEGAGTAGVAMHGMTPDRVLRWLPAGAAPPFLRLVGCEPATFGEEGLGRDGLSPPVAGAIEPAARLVQRIVGELIGADSERA